MNDLPGKSATAALVSAAIAMRMFWGLAVDFPFAMNASWLCPLLGMLLYLPLGLAIRQMMKCGNKSIWENLSAGLHPWLAHIVEALFFLLVIYDAAVVVRLTASSSNLVALNNVTVHILIFPLTLLIAAIVLLGGDASGNSARLWLKVLPAFGLVLLAAQINKYRLGWLTPILGGGLNSIINGGIYCAGCLSLFSLTWLIALPDRNKHSMLPYALFSSIVVSLLMLMQHLSFPAMINIPFTRAARIELILSNGRMSLSPQLILDVLWFGSLLHLLSAEVITASTYLRFLFVNIPKWILALFIAGIITVCAVFNPLWLRASEKVTRLLFPAIGGIFICIMLVSKSSKESCQHV